MVYKTILLLIQTEMCFSTYIIVIIIAIYPKQFVNLLRLNIKDMENPNFILKTCNLKDGFLLTNSKNIFFLPAFFFLIISTFSFSQSVTKNQKSVSGELTIATKHDVILPAADLSSHKHYDVEICRTDFNGSPDMYMIKYYKKESGTLRGFEAWYEAKGNFTKASYKWKNDTLAVRLFNNSRGHEKRFKLYGKGTKSGIYRW